MAGKHLNDSANKAVLRQPLSARRYAWRPGSCQFMVASSVTAAAAAAVPVASQIFMWSWFLLMLAIKNRKRIQFACPCREANCGRVARHVGCFCSTRNALRHWIFYYILGFRHLAAERGLKRRLCVLSRSGARAPAIRTLHPSSHASVSLTPRTSSSPTTAATPTSL